MAAHLIPDARRVSGAVDEDERDGQRAPALARYSGPAVIFFHAVRVVAHRGLGLLETTVGVVGVDDRDRVGVAEHLEDLDPLRSGGVPVRGSRLHRKAVAREQRLFSHEVHRRARHDDVQTVDVVLVSEQREVRLEEEVHDGQAAFFTRLVHEEAAGRTLRTGEGGGDVPKFGVRAEVARGDPALVELRRLGGSMDPYPALGVLGRGCHARRIRGLLCGCGRRRPRVRYWHHPGSEFGFQWFRGCTMGRGGDHLGRRSCQGATRGLPRLHRPEVARRVRRVADELRRHARRVRRSGVRRGRGVGPEEARRGARAPGCGGRSPVRQRCTVRGRPGRLRARPGADPPVQHGVQPLGRRLLLGGARPAARAGAGGLRRHRPGGEGRLLGEGAGTGRDPDAAAVPRLEVLLRSRARSDLGRVRGRRPPAQPARRHRRAGLPADGLRGVHGARGRALVLLRPVVVAAHPRRCVRPVPRAEDRVHRDRDLVDRADDRPPRPA